MAIFAKTYLSNSNGGIPIQVTGTTAAGSVIIHTGPTTTTTVHEVYIYANSTASTSTTLTLGYGGTGGATQITQTIQPQSGLTLVVPGLILQGSATAKTISAWAGAASAINITGFVNTIT